MGCGLGWVRLIFFFILPTPPPPPLMTTFFHRCVCMLYSVKIAANDDDDDNNIIYNVMMAAAPGKRVSHRVGLMIVAGHIWCVSSIMSNPGALPETERFSTSRYYHYCCCCSVSSVHYFWCHGENPSSAAGNESRPYKSHRKAMNEMWVYRV